MKFLSGFVFILLGLIVFNACQSAETEPPLPQRPSLAESNGSTIPPLPKLTAAEIALGQTVYAQHCAACHGVNLEGQPDWKTQNEDGSFKAPPHSADGHTWHHADGQLLEAIQLGGARFEGLNIGGSSPMPAYADILSDEEMTAVLTYIKSTWPEDIRQTQWEVTFRTSQQ